MKTIKHVVAILLCISLCAPLTQAQPAPDKRQDAQTAKPVAQDVLIIIQQEQVRFAAQRPVEEMRLQIVDQAGQLVYDSGDGTRPELTWVLRQANGEAVKSGLYAYTLLIKEAGAETSRARHGYFIVDLVRDRDGKTDRLWITSRNDSDVGAELMVVRDEGGAIARTSVVAEQKSMGAEREAASNDEEELMKNNAVEPPTAANGTIGRIAKFTSATDLGDSVITELNGAIGIGTIMPATKLEVTGDWTGEDGALRVSGDKPTIRFTGGAISGNQSWILHQGSEGPGNLQFFSRVRANTWNPVMSLGANGNVGIGMNATTHRLEIAGQFGLAISGFQPFLTLSDTSSILPLKSRIQNVHGGLNFQTDDQTGYGGSSMFIENITHNIGVGTASPQFKLDVIGTTKTNLLMITGGADFAENFEVNAATTGSEAMSPRVEAGMVVSLDPASPGKLQISAQAYDRRVAGVISGAGGVKPGMIMGQEGTLADGKHPVALTGRVYCRVDASQGAIEPGDLLTTSSTPGHAMKVTDVAKAQGAIIGKAMTGLKEGKGLILMLVTLQ